MRSGQRCQSVAPARAALWAGPFGVVPCWWPRPWVVVGVGVAPFASTGKPATRGITQCVVMFGRASPVGGGPGVGFAELHQLRRAAQSTITSEVGVCKSLWGFMLGGAPQWVTTAFLLPGLSGVWERAGFNSFTPQQPQP